MPSSTVRLSEDVLEIGRQAAAAKGLGNTTADARRAIEAIVRCHADTWIHGDVAPAQRPPTAPAPVPISASDALDDLISSL